MITEYDCRIIIINILLGISDQSHFVKYWTSWLFNAYHIKQWELKTYTGYNSHKPNKNNNILITIFYVLLNDKQNNQEL